MSDKQKLIQQAWNNIDNLSKELWNLSLKIHSNPELAYEEEYASNELIKALQKNSRFKVEKGIGGLETSFRADHKGVSGGPRVALIAEYDALPNIGHGCGHNLIATIATGAALGLSPQKGGLRGSITVLGTPAEEKGGGKIDLLKKQVFSDFDVSLMVHPGNETFSFAKLLALSNVRVGFTGKAAHASANPEEGINALSAMIDTFQLVNGLRQQLKGTARINGIIEEGGEEPNIIPDRSVALFQVRDVDSSYQEQLVEKLKVCAKAAGRASSASLNFEILSPSYKPFLPNITLADLFENYITSLGYQTVHPGIVHASTDMGNVSWEVPSLHSHISITEKSIPLHSREFTKAAKSELAKKAMIASAKALAAIVVELSEEPKIFNKTVEEFEKKAK